MPSVFTHENNARSSLTQGASLFFTDATDPIYDGNSNENISDPIFSKII